MFGSSMFETGLHRPANADGLEYWRDVAALHIEHRHHVRNLLGVAAALAVLAVVIDPVMLGFVAALTPLLLLELWMVRRSRPTSRIPDYRSTARVDIDIDIDHS